MTKNYLSICADDFGITSNVNLAILNLVKIKSLTEVSCITLTKNFEFDAIKLKEYKNDISVGLHLTLTDFKPLSGNKFLIKKNKMFSAKDLFSKCVFNKIPDIYFLEEINLQIEKFKNILGFYPDFIDGHQHIHQFPVIRRCLIKILKEKKLHDKIWIRNSSENISSILVRKVSILKCLILSMFGNSFKKKLIKENIKTNDGFSGIYDFSEKKDYTTLFKKFIIKNSNNHLIMVHPGFSDQILSDLDSVTKTRDLEYEFFSSNFFFDILRRNNITLKKLFS